MINIIRLFPKLVKNLLLSLFLLKFSCLGRYAEKVYKTGEPDMAYGTEGTSGRPGWNVENIEKGLQEFGTKLGEEAPNTYGLTKSHRVVTESDYEFRRRFDPDVQDAGETFQRCKDRFNQFKKDLGERRVRHSPPSTPHMNPQSQARVNRPIYFDANDQHLRVAGLEGVKLLYQLAKQNEDGRYKYSNHADRATIALLIKRIYEASGDRWLPQMNQLIGRWTDEPARDYALNLLQQYSGASPARTPSPPSREVYQSPRVGEPRGSPQSRMNEYQQSQQPPSGNFGVTTPSARRESPPPSAFPVFKSPVEELAKRYGITEEEANEVEKLAGSSLTLQEKFLDVRAPCLRQLKGMPGMPSVKEFHALLEEHHIDWKQLSLKDPVEFRKLMMPVQKELIAIALGVRSASQAAKDSLTMINLWYDDRLGEQARTLHWLKQQPGVDLSADEMMYGLCSQKLSPLNVARLRQKNLSQEDIKQRTSRQVRHIKAAKSELTKIFKANVDNATKGTGVGLHTPVRPDGNCGFFSLSILTGKDYRELRKRAADVANDLARAESRRLVQEDAAYKRRLQNVIESNREHEKTFPREESHAERARFLAIDPDNYDRGEYPDLDPHRCWMTVDDFQYVALAEKTPVFLLSDGYGFNSGEECYLQYYTGDGVLHTCNSPESRAEAQKLLLSDENAVAVFLDANKKHFSPLRKLKPVQPESIGTQPLPLAQEESPVPVPRKRRGTAVTTEQAPRPAILEADPAPAPPPLEFTGKLTGENLRGVLGSQAKELIEKWTDSVLQENTRGIEKSELIDAWKKKIKPESVLESKVRYECVGITDEAQDLSNTHFDPNLCGIRTFEDEKGRFVLAYALPVARIQANRKFHEYKTPEQNREALQCLKNEGGIGIKLHVKPPEPAAKASAKASAKEVSRSSSFDGMRTREEITELLGHCASDILEVWQFTTKKPLSVDVGYECTSLRDLDDNRIAPLDPYLSGVEEKLRDRTGEYFLAYSFPAGRGDKYSEFKNLMDKGLLYLASDVLKEAGGVSVKIHK